MVDLMRLQPHSEHPHGLSDAEFDAIFTTDRPIIFAYHGYPWLIHRLTYRRTATTTCTCAATRRRAPPPRRSTWWCATTWTASTWSSTSSTGCPGSPAGRPPLRQHMVDKRTEHREYIRRTGEDLPEVAGWTWPG